MTGVQFNPAPGWPEPPSPEWLPHDGWNPDPSWPPAPPGWPVLLADVPLDRPRFWTWPHAVRSRAQWAASLADRRPVGWEIWLVLLVFPGDAVVSAIASLVISHLDPSDDQGRLPVDIAGHVVVSSLLDAAVAVFTYVPALVVVYLLHLSGGGLRAIGLDRDSPRADLARSAKLFAFAYLVPFVVVGGIVSSVVKGDDLSSPDRLVYLLPYVLFAVGAGVVEEIVVLGYLVHRLEQRGWDGPRLVLVCLAVRVSYHLYYGLGVIPLAVWGLVSVLLYRRRRRLLPFIVVHALWDTVAFSTTFLHGAVEAVPFLVLLVLTLVLLARGRVVAKRGPAVDPVPSLS